MHRLTLLLCGLAISLTATALELEGESIQGGLLFGTVNPGSRVSLDGEPLIVSREGRFVVGFGRDDSETRVLEVVEPGQASQRIELAPASREYDIERVDGVPQRTVTPDPEALERIRAEARMVSASRERRDLRADWAAGFEWPVHGRISGVYGSQRVLNGQPARPHFGVDVAAPAGTPVHAPANGVVTLAQTDLYYSGGTVVLDHGQGLSSSFLHLSAVLVEVGQEIARGEVIGRVGMTGRASGPHLDWRMNWLDRRVDPQLLVNSEANRTAP